MMRYDDDINSIKKKGVIHAYENYGHFVTVNEVYKSDKTYIVDLKVEYPLYVVDDKNSKIYHNRIVDIYDIGHLVYTNKGELINFPERKDCDLVVKDRLNFWREKLEKIIISTTSQQIAQISRYSNVWNPINFIVSSIIDNTRVSEEDFRKSQPSKIVRYLNLLENLEVIQYNDDEYEFYPEINIKYKQLSSEDELKKWILSLIIEKRYKTIRDVFHIRQLMPTIRTENVYYIPALHADELLYKTLNSLTQYYVEWYDSSVSYLDVQYWLKDLVSVGIMNLEDGYYFGDDRMFNEMMKRKDEVPNRIPPVTYL